MREHTMLDYIISYNNNNKFCVYMPPLGWLKRYQTPPQNTHTSSSSDVFVFVIVIITLLCWLLLFEWLGRAWIRCREVRHRRSSTHVYLGRILNLPFSPSILSSAIHPTWFEFPRPSNDIIAYFCYHRVVLPYKPYRISDLNGWYIHHPSIRRKSLPV